MKGMIEYKSQNGGDLGFDINSFHGFIKNDIHSVDASVEQLWSKIKDLKRTYSKLAKKSENGHHPISTKPHDQELFDLSKEIWEH